MLVLASKRYEDICMNTPVIVSTSRSPIGRAFKGSLISTRADDLMAFILKDVIGKINLDKKLIDDVVIGCGLPGGEQGYNIARVASLLAGLENTSATTINRYCASSLQAIAQSASHIAAGYGEVFIAGGVECTSRFLLGTSDSLPNTMNPKFDVAQKRSLDNSSKQEYVWSPTVDNELPDIYVAMGITSENVADAYGVTREEMDQYAFESQMRCAQAIERGFFEQEITPYKIEDGTIVSADDCPRPTTTIEALNSLPSSFRLNGRVTAGNACPLNDGAAAVVVMSESKANELGLEAIARIVGATTTGLDPEIMGVGPIEAVKKVLAQTKLTMNDIDLVELNEAFAAQVIPCMKELKIDREKLNVNGGAIALGHPFGATGARIMTTLLHSMSETGARYGLETMCVGGGQGMAMIVEKL